MKAWKSYHKHECLVLVRLKALCGADPPRNARAALRLVLLHDAGKLPQSTFDQVLSLHINRRIPQTVQASFNQDAQFIKHITDTEISSETVYDLQNIMRTNSVGIKNLAGDIIGSELYLKLSKANHSCVENAQPGDLEDVLWDRSSSLHMTAVGPFPYKVLMASKDIVMGEEITVNYLGGAELPDVQSQRARMQQLWGFICTCARCEASGSGALDA